MCIVWATMDVLMCTASIWHMATISVNRYCSFRFPLRYRRTQTPVFVVAKIAFVWIVSIGICSPLAIAGFVNPQNVYRDGQCAPAVPEFVIYGSIFAFYVPLLLMLVTYALTVKTLSRHANWRRDSKHRSSIRRSSSQHRKTADDSPLESPQVHPLSSSLRRKQSLRESQVLRRQPDASTTVVLDDQCTTGAEAGAAEAQTNGPDDEYRELCDGGTRSMSQLMTSPQDGDVHINGECICPAAGPATQNNDDNKKGDISDDDDRQRQLDDSCRNQLPAVKRRRTVSLRPADFTTVHGDDDDDSMPAQRAASVTKQNSVADARVTAGRQSLSTQTRRLKRKATRVLGVIFIVFIVLWTPFFVLNVLSAACPRCVQSVDPSVWTALVWLGWISSFANPIIYTCFSPAFRSAFKQLLMCRCCQRMSKRRQHELSSVMSRIRCDSQSSQRRPCLTMSTAVQS